MEMHQIRYFLAVSRCLNFTRAAEECHVSQPALTRAVKLLEYELGGELVRRERSHTHLTPLGERMLPLLRQCYESASHAKALAGAIGSRKVSSLRIALPHSVDVAPFLPHLIELGRGFDELSLRCVRGSAPEVLESLREGKADLAVAPSNCLDWDRIESWPLFEEEFGLALSARHPLAARERVRPDELQGETMLVRCFCEETPHVAERLATLGVRFMGRTELASERDAIAFVEANAGIAIAPAGLARAAGLRVAPLEGLALRRQIRVFAVAGRQRGPAATMLLNQLRAADWRLALQETRASA